MVRKNVKQRLHRALEIAQDPATVYCVHPFSAVENDGGEHLGRLLARMMNDPDRAVFVATDKAFVFAFGNHVASEGDLRKQEETLTPSLPEGT